MKKILPFLVTLFCFTSLAQAGEIRLDVWPDETAMKSLAKAYEEANPGSKVSLLVNQFDDHHKKLIMNLATGSGAGDVVGLDVGYIASIINEGGLEALSDPPYNAGDLHKDIVSFAWEQGRGKDGKLYAIPIDIGPGVMYYRSDYLEKANMTIEKVIKDWDSFIEYGRRLKPYGIKLIGDPADLAQLIIDMSAKPGEGRFFDENGQSLITSDRFVQAFTVAKKIRDEGLDSRVAAGNEWVAGLRNGTIATHPSAAWFLGHLQNAFAPESAGLWKVSFLPGQTFGATGGSFLIIPKQAKNKEEAWNLVKFVAATVPSQISLMTTGGAFPSYLPAWKDPSFDEPIAYLGGQQARLLFAEAAQKIPPTLPQKADSVAKELVISGLREVLNEGKDIRKALEEAERMVIRRQK